MRHPRQADRPRQAAGEKDVEHLQVLEGTAEAFAPLSGFLVAEEWRQIDGDVLADPKYIRPATGDHFLWRDLFPALAAAADDHVLVSWLRDAFEVLGYTPPIPGIGQLEGKGEEVEAARRNFAKYWTKARAAASALGWSRITPGSQIELYLEGKEDSPSAGVWISPPLRGRFRIRFTPREGQLEGIAQRVKSFAADSRVPLVADVVAVPRKAGNVLVVELSSSLRVDTSDVTAIENDLAAVVAGALSASDTR